MLAMLIVFIFFSGMLCVVGYTIKNRISPTPSSAKVKLVVKKLLPLGSYEKIYELGSGWGGMARLLAKHYPDSQVFAYESSPVPYVFSILWNIAFPLGNLRFYRENFFDLELSQADLVLCYLYPEAMEDLGEKFKRELKQGTKVISHTFAIAAWKELEKKNVDDLYNTPVYFYEKKNEH